MSFLILALATWRLTKLIVEEAGPWSALSRLRHALGVRYDEHSMAYGTNVVAQGLTCVWCASVWIGLSFGVAYLIWKQATLAVALPLALSAGAIIVERIIDG